jgi:hypothetical protein
VSCRFHTHLCHGRAPRRGGPDAERGDEQEPPELRGVVVVAEARVHKPLHDAVGQVRLGLHITVCHIRYNAGIGGSGTSRIGIRCLLNA